METTPARYWAGELVLWSQEQRFYLVVANQARPAGWYYEIVSLDEPTVRHEGVPEHELAPVGGPESDPPEGQNSGGRRGLGAAAETAGEEMVAPAAEEIPAEEAATDAGQEAEEAASEASPETEVPLREETITVGRRHDQSVLVIGGLELPIEGDYTGERTVLEEAPLRHDTGASSAPQAEAAPVPPLPPPSAPRVLNANFSDAETARSLGPNEALVHGGSYDLLVDVGPPSPDSIVAGKREFPDHALPPNQTGYAVQVVLISDDFTPRLITADMWVPHGAGQSRPIHQGTTAEASGPVALRVRAPQLPSGAGPTEVRGRLSLYYENNLLQSGVVRAKVTRAGARRLKSANAIEMDYALTADFRQVEHLSGRRLRLSPEAPVAEHPVAVNFTMNDDGAGGHRIIVKNSSGLPPAWTPYDPIGMKQTLDRARTELINCFFLRDETSAVQLDRHKQPMPGMNGQNGKARDQFSRDLYALVRVGHLLLTQGINQAHPDAGNAAPGGWVRDLLDSLRTSTVIQVARTANVPAEYVFPWGLVYDNYVEGPLIPLHFCPVLSEWNDAGFRSGPLATRCPHQDEPEHQKNVICPYGFWGLKHVIEQPLAALQPVDGKWQAVGATNQIPDGTGVKLAVGITQDTSLPAGLIPGHVRNLGQIPRVQLQPTTPAVDLTSVQSMLASPTVVYFICHGEYDASVNEPYLGVGPRDSDSSHRIYPDTIFGWANWPRPPSLAAWSSRRPFVFVNGCQTANLQPGQVLSLATAFAQAQASGVLGTEVSVQLPVAIEVAQALIAKLASGEPVGQALREIRWDLVNKGNLLGLCYTLYGLADLGISPSA